MSSQRSDEGTTPVLVTANQTPADSTRQQRTRRAFRWLCVVVGAILLSLGWASSSPAGASPDEPAHIVYAWGVATGQALPWNANEETFDESVALLTVDVPNALYERPPETCYAFKTDPACADADGAPGSSLQTTYMTRYPPLYYALVGIPLRVMLQIGTSGSVALVAARTLSALISLAVVGFAAVSTTRRFGPVPVAIGFLVSMTPQFLFLSASLNPNGFEIASALALAAFVVCSFADARKRPSANRDTSVGLVISAFFLGLARPASLVWLLPLLALLFVRAHGRPRPWKVLSWSTRVFLIIAAVASVASFTYMNGLRGGGVSDHETDGWAELSVGVRLTLVALRFGELVYNGFGLLGWIDTQLPMLFFVAWLIASVFAIGRAFPSTKADPCLRARWAVIVMAIFCAGVAGQSYLAAFGWQGRYFFPCIAAFVALLIPTFAAGPAKSPGLRRTTTVLFLVVATLDTLSLAWNLGRYLYGMTDTYVRFNQLPLPSPYGEWEPLVGRFTPLALGVIGIVLIGSIVLPRILRGDRSGARQLDATKPRVTETHLQG